MNHPDLLPHLFRTEYAKITAVLCTLFGIERIEMAEDIASETFLAAIKTWTYKGIPENPTAWLYAVAKNKANNQFRRQHIFKNKVIDQINHSKFEIQEEIDWSSKNITDSQLQMLFAICHPILPIEAQVGLALRILCGFGIEEIANAFLTNKETINKRLYRAKETLRQIKGSIEIPSEKEISNRLVSVLTTLYLLFNEGYYSESNQVILREELCDEAMRLTYMLIEYPPTNLPVVNALYALMCFHASRFLARKDERGEMILYQDQDESLWNQSLIDQGIYFLHLSSQGNRITPYHIEASIAYWQTIKSDTSEKWENILSLYNHLLQIKYSPIAALNRAFALSKVKGIEEAIQEAEKLQLSNNHYYLTLLGVLYSDYDPVQAKNYFHKAWSIAKTPSDKATIERKMLGLIKH